MFSINPALLDKAREVFSHRNNLYWILGGACSGKTTLCAGLSAHLRIQVYDMDAKIYGDFIPRYSRSRHPASSAWFLAENPLGYILSLPLDAYEELNRAADVEYLDLLADEFLQQENDQPWIVDGGFTHPAVLAQVVPPQKILTLLAAEELTRHCWESPERQEMKQWVMALPEPEKMWEQFLACDNLINQVMETESQQAGIAILYRSVGTSVDDLIGRAITHFNLASPGQGSICYPQAAIE